MAQRFELNSLPRTEFGGVFVANKSLDAIARGSVKVGGTGNVAADLVAKTSGQILVGNGTDLVSVAMSGDATLASTGVLTLGANVVTGAKASGTLQSKVGQATLPTVATTGTTEVCMVVPFAGTISGVQVAFKDALAQHATNYLTFAIVNKTNGNAAVLAATDANTTKTSTGNAISAYTTRVPPLSGTSANLVVAAGDVLALQFISNSTLANTLTEG